MPDNGLEENAGIDLKWPYNSFLEGLNSLMDKTTQNQIANVPSEEIRSWVKDAYQVPLSTLHKMLPSLYLTHLRLYDVFASELIIDYKDDIECVPRKERDRLPSLSDFYSQPKEGAGRCLPVTPASLLIITETRNIENKDYSDMADINKVLLIDNETRRSINDTAWEKYEDKEKFDQNLKKFINDIADFLFNVLKYKPTSPQSKETALIDAYNIIQHRTSEKSQEGPTYFDYLIPAVFGKNTIYLLATYALSERTNVDNLKTITRNLGMMAGAVSYSYTQKKMGELFGDTYDRIFGVVLWDKLENHLSKDSRQTTNPFAQHIAKTLEVLKKRLFEGVREKNIAEVIFEEFQKPLLIFISGNDFINDECKDKAKGKDCDYCQLEDRNSCLGRYLPYRMLYNALDFQDTLKNMPRYREHFIHSFHVFLLGYYMMKKLGVKNFNSTTLTLSSDDEILKAWFLASMYHDVSYPIAKVESWLGEFYRKVVLESKDRKRGVSTLKKDPHVMPIPLDQELSRLFLHEEYQRAFNLLYRGLVRIHTDIPPEQLPIVENRIMRYLLEKKDHGILSAVLFLNSFKTKNKDSHTIRLAADAILWHNDLWFFEKKNEDQEEKEHTKQIEPLITAMMEFGKNPLCNLLAFCDTAQEWGRHESNEYERMFEVKLVDLDKRDKDRIAIRIVRDPSNKISQEELDQYYLEWVNEIEPKLMRKGETFSFVLPCPTSKFRIPKIIYQRSKEPYEHLHEFSEEFARVNELKSKSVKSEIIFSRSS